MLCDFVYVDAPSVWIVGDSLVYWAGRWHRAQQTPRAHTRLIFHGRRGATISTLKPLLLSLWPTGGPPPPTVVIHAGCNDLSNSAAVEQRAQIQALWAFLGDLSPETEFIWSDILPKAGRYCAGDTLPGELQRMERVRKDTNRFARRMSMRRGGRFIPHPLITNSNELYRPDGIHLSPAGQEIFVGDLLRGPAI
jgi:lysophospholipase L1-like esterase